MYRYFTIGGETVVAYELINDCVSYFMIAVIFLTCVFTKKLDIKLITLGYDATEPLRKKGGMGKFFGKPLWILLNAAGTIGYFYLYGAMNELFLFLSDYRYFTYENYFKYIFFGLIPMLPVLMVTGADIRKQIDFLTPFFALQMGLGKIACFFAGCCSGVESSHGFYNYTTGQVEFPVQIVECAVGLILAGILFYLNFSKKEDGKIYPVYMILYSATRFCTEFLRGDFDANWLGMKPFQVLCLIGIVVGAVWLIVIRILKKHNKRPLYQTDCVSRIIEKIKSKKA